MGAEVGETIATTRLAITVVSKANVEQLYFH